MISSAIPNNFRSSNGDLPNTPPTQEGGNRGNGGNTQGPGRPGDHANKLPQQPQGLLEESLGTTSLTFARSETSIQSLVVTRKSFVSSKFLTAVPGYNPVLIGEPGVGKTANVEGLAKNCRW